MSTVTPDPKNRRSPAGDRAVVADPAVPAEQEEMVTGTDKTKRLFRSGMFTLIGIIILVIGVFVIAILIVGQTFVF